MVDANKDLIRRMFRAQLANDIPTYRALLADELVWEIMQFGELGRPRGKEEIISMLGLVHRNLNGGRWEKTIIGMTAEGERVAVEAVASMELSNGNLYRQRYHYVYVIRNGQVVEAREYLDTLSAADAFKGLRAVTDGPPSGTAGADGNSV